MCGILYLLLQTYSFIFINCTCLSTLKIGLTLLFNWSLLEHIKLKVRKAAAGFGLAAKGSFDQILVVSLVLPVTQASNLNFISTFSITNWKFSGLELEKKLGFILVNYKNRSGAYYWGNLYSIFHCSTWEIRYQFAD